MLNVLLASALYRQEENSLLLLTVFFLLNATQLLVQNMWVTGPATVAVRDVEFSFKRLYGMRRARKVARISAPSHQGLE